MGRLQHLDSSVIEIPHFIPITQLQSDIISFVYPNLQNPDSWNDCAILTTTNEKMRQINDEVFELLPGQTRVYYSFDSAANNTDPEVITEDYLNSLHPTGLPPHELRLKVNMPLCLSGI